MSDVCLSFILFGVFINLSTGFYFENRHWTHTKFHANLKRVFHESSSSGNICCANGQWEANAYIIASTILTFENVSMVGFYNGTGRIAFDEVNKKSYISFNVTESAPGVSKHYHRKSTVIKDFSTGITYEIDDGSCLKLPNSEGMEIVCIPENAKKISSGIFGSTDVTTYQFSSGNPPLEIVTTPTVRQNGSYCETIMLSYALFLDYGAGEFIYDVDVVDLTHGIQDPTIFLPPKSCE